MIEADLLLTYCDLAFDIVIVYYLKKKYCIHFSHLIRSYKYTSFQNVATILMTDSKFSFIVIDLS